MIQSVDHLRVQDTDSFMIILIPQNEQDQKDLVKLLDEGILSSYSLILGSQRSEDKFEKAEIALLSSESPKERTESFAMAVSQQDTEIN